MNRPDSALRTTEPLFPAVLQTAVLGMCYTFRPRALRPLPSDAGLYPYLFGWTPSPAQNAQKIEWKTWSSMLSPTRGSNATNDRQRKIGRILDVFRRNDGVQPKRYGTRPASDGRGLGWARCCSLSHGLRKYAQSDAGLPDGAPFVSVIDAIPTDGFNPVWEEVQINFTAGNTPRQLF